MDAHGLLGDEQLIGNLAIRAPGSQDAQHLVFAFVNPSPVSFVRAGSSGVCAESRDTSLPGDRLDAIANGVAPARPPSRAR